MDRQRCSSGEDRHGISAFYIFGDRAAGRCHRVGDFGGADGAGLFLDGFAESGAADSLVIQARDIHLGVARAALSVPMEHPGSGWVARFILTGGVEAWTQLGGNDLAGALLGQDIVFGPGGLDSVAGLFAGGKAEVVTWRGALLRGVRGSLGRRRLAPHRRHNGVTSAFLTPIGDAASSIGGQARSGAARSRKAQLILPHLERALPILHRLTRPELERHQALDVINGLAVGNIHLTAGSPPREDLIGDSQGGADQVLLDIG